MNRLERVQSYIRSRADEMDAMVINDMVNLQYVSDFTGTTGIAFITPTQAFFLTDARYIEQAHLQCKGFEVLEVARASFAGVAELLCDHMHKWVKRIAFPANKMSYDTVMRLQNAILDAGITDVELTPITLEMLRSVKTEEELSYLRRAAEIADAAFQELLPQLKPGMTENEARILLECAMLRHGSQGKSFDTIVASGPRSAMPHGVASDRVMELGDFVTFDFGAMYRGYHSDMTRTIVLGKASDKQRTLYNAVLDAQKLGVSMVKAGIPCKTLDEMVRKSLEVAGYGDAFSHSLGHGVGLDIHELPVAAGVSTDILEPNMVVTIEPGVYFAGEQGLRIEDTVIVTGDGCEIITKTPKELLEIY